MRGDSWGRLAQSTPRRLEAAQWPVTIPNDSFLLAYGNGRSYGDSCQLADGVLLDMKDLDWLLAFDQTKGCLRCAAGAQLAQIIEFVLPKGWFLPVTPGTKFVTIGGAVANDVHGKNHHKAGSFGCHVRAFELLRSDGSRTLCSPIEQAELFAATIGGLGLTGVITWVDLQLLAVSGPYLATETCRFGAVDEFLSLSQAKAADTYHVAWVDCSPGRRAGRGIFAAANHASVTRGPPGRSRQISAPVTPPVSLITPFTLRAFNWQHYHRQSARPVQKIEHYDPYFYPLDALGQWNRFYGPRGFYQYQCVIPLADAADGLRQMLAAIAGSRAGSFLAVLKQFGTIASPGMLSFPRPGVTLAVDFPNRGRSTHQLLDRLDAIVAELNGALYPAKDARMSPDMFRRSFPQLERFLPFVDPRFSSDFWRRVVA